MKFSKIFLPILILVFASSNAQIDTKILTKTIDDFSVQNNNCGISVLISEEEHNIFHAVGLANKEKNKKIKTKDLFEIGSASKMFTAIAILQLIEQGKFSLNTTLDTFYPESDIKKLANFKDENYWNQVTIEMLLNHTSGFVDYLNVYGDDEKALKIFSVKGKEYSFKEITDLAINHGDANFKPGKQFKYCNTGYIILGDIIRIKSGLNWRDYIQKNILDVVKMKNTFFGSRISQKDEKRKMRGYFKGKESFMPPTLAGSAGELVSNTKDLEKFLLAWQQGKLFNKPETLQIQRTKGFHQMYEQSTVLTYGYGVMLIDGFYGHGGQTFGFQSYITYNPTKKKIYVIGINDAKVEAMNLFLEIENINIFE